nr:unnamed protein product [Callosobruchus chinensis]
MISDIDTFIKKLEFWELNLINNDTKHFPSLLENSFQNPLQPYHSRYHVEIVSNLKERSFRRYHQHCSAGTTCCFTIHGD